MNNNTSSIDTTNKKRIYELDVLRAICIILMIIDHFTLFVDFSGGIGGWASYLFSNYYEVNNTFIDSFVGICHDFQYSILRDAGHYIVATIFLVLVGINCAFSRSNFKRSLKIGIAAIIIGIVTTALSLISGEDLYIIFGVLSCLAVSILIISVIEKFFPSKWLYLIVGIIIVLWGFIIEWWAAPRIYYITSLNFSSLVDIILGFKVYGQDHFGLIPCTGVIFIGVFIGKTLYRKRKSLLPKLEGKWTVPFKFVSKHALLIYLIHQVVSVILILLMYFIAGYRI